MCPSYPLPKRTPNRKQVITYVVNAWKFRSPRDNIGYEHIGFSKITVNTVAYHVDHIYEKLEAVNAPAAVAQGFRLGIFKDND
jgi:hypothetical protein